MTQLQSCLITPSYKPDFKKCCLLAESIDSYAVFPIQHYIVVDRKDLRLFQQLENSYRKVVTVESILPWWIQKLPLLKNGWFSFQTLPVRNWLMQQIIKLEIVNHIAEDVLIFVDSDVTFVRDFNSQQFIQGNRVRLFRVDLSPSDPSFSSLDLTTQTKWQNTAASLLGISSLSTVIVPNPFIGYVGNVITWRKDNVLKLHRHIERVTGKSWIKAIASCWNFSEYMLYGIFVDRVLKENSGHYWDSQRSCQEYWGTTPLNQKQLQQFFQTMPDEAFSIMISAKSDTPVSAYAPLVKNVS